MNGDDLLNGIGKDIGDLFMAVLDEEDAVSVSEDYEVDATLNTSAATDFDESNVEGHCQDTFTSGNGPSTHSSLNSTAIEDGNGDGRVVGAVATFLFNHLTNAADDLQSSFDDTCSGSAADIESSGITQRSHLTSSYVSEGTFDVETSNVSTERKDETLTSKGAHATNISQAEKDTNASDSNEQQSQKAASAALMLAQMGSNETDSSSIIDRNGAVCDDNECTAEQKGEINAISLALPLDSVAADTSSVPKVAAEGGDSIVCNKISIESAGNEDQRDGWQSASMEASAIGFETRSRTSPTKCAADLKQPQEQTGKTLADIYLDIERAIDEDKARTPDINGIPPTSRCHAVAEEVPEASDETFDERILSNNETDESTSLCTPENSAWEKELAPRDDDLKNLERKLRECARLESTSVTYEEMSTVPTSALKNVIGQSFKISPRIRSKAMKLKATRKGSRYNGSYARKTTEPTVKKMIGPRISPVKCVGTTLKADIATLKADIDVGDAFSPAKTADITEDASISFGSAEKNAVLYVS